MYTQETHDTLNVPENASGVPGASEPVLGGPGRGKSRVDPAAVFEPVYRVRCYFQDTGDKVYGSDGSDTVDVPESRLAEVLAMVRRCGYIGTAERV